MAEAWKFDRSGQAQQGACTSTGDGGARPKNPRGLLTVISDAATKIGSMTSSPSHHVLHIKQFGCMLSSRSMQVLLGCIRSIASFDCMSFAQCTHPLLLQEMIDGHSCYLYTGPGGQGDVHKFHSGARCSPTAMQRVTASSY